MDDQAKEIVEAVLDGVDKEAVKKINSIAQDLAESKDARLSFAEIALQAAMENAREESKAKDERHDKEMKRKTITIWVFAGIAFVQFVIMVLVVMWFFANVEVIDEWNQQIVEWHTGDPEFKGDVNIINQQPENE